MPRPSSELGVECVWTGGDAPTCLPPYRETIVFADDDCTEPLAEMLRADASDPCPTPRPAYP